jgi:uncharacterized RDD family membrane protein YckC
MESSPPIPASPPEPAQASPIAVSQTAFHEGLTAEVTAAPLLKRFLAYCVDWGILGALSYPAILLGVVLFGALLAVLTVLLVNQDTAFSGNGFLATIAVLLLALVFLLAYLSCIHGYFIYYHWKQGATPGKRIFGLKVISLDGTPLKRDQCILREVLVYFDLGFIFPGLISILATQRKQRLGDLAAGTMVLHSPRIEQQDDYLYITREEYLMLKDILTLQPISTHFSEEFLRFAYPYFITRQTTPSAAELGNWEIQARRYLTDAAAHRLDQRSLLLMFAEYCFQTKRA